MNAVIFKAHTAAVALNNSKYDPSIFTLQETYKRALELHTCFNPYQTNHPANSRKASGLPTKSVTLFIKPLY